MKTATLTLRQDFHDNLAKEPSGAGKVCASYKLPFEKGYCIPVGRNPKLGLANEVIYVPSQYITRHLGLIRCVETAQGTLHIFSFDSDKTKVFNNHNGEEIVKLHTFKDGDCLKLDGVPVFLEYCINLSEKDTGNVSFKDTVW